MLSAVCEPHACCNQQGNFPQKFLTVFNLFAFHRECPSNFTLYRPSPQEQPMSSVPPLDFSPALTMHGFPHTQGQ